jgi:hypothetical protein
MPSGCAIPLPIIALLDWFLAHAGDAELVVANGDYSCDSAFVGVSDDAAAQSAALCLGRLRERFGAAFQAVIGDHELGKIPLAGNQGECGWPVGSGRPRELGLLPCWRVDLGPWVVLGLTSSLLALPVLAPEIPLQRHAPPGNSCARTTAARSPPTRDPRAGPPSSAFPPRSHRPALSWPICRHADRLRQVAATVIGHLHSPLILWKSRMLAGVPPIRRLGHAVRRMSQALHQARSWRPFPRAPVPLPCRA